MSTLTAILLTLSLSSAALADEEGVVLPAATTPSSEVVAMTADLMRAPLLDLTPQLEREFAELGTGTRYEHAHLAASQQDCSVARDGCVMAAAVTVSLGRKDNPTSPPPASNAAATLQEIARREQRRGELDGLFNDLQDVWENGEPLLPGAGPAATPHDRRKAILHAWTSEPDTPMGQARRDVIEEFLVHVVQPSPWPVARQELDVAHASCGCTDALDL